MAQERLCVDAPTEKGGVMAACVELGAYPVTNAGDMKIDMRRIHAAAELVDQLLRVRGVGWGDFN